MKPEEIKALRLSLEETTEQFGRRIGVSAMTIRRWEAGQATPHPYWREKLRQLRVQMLQQKLDELKAAILVS